MKAIARVLVSLTLLAPWAGAAEAPTVTVAVGNVGDVAVYEHTWDYIERAPQQRRDAGGGSARFIVTAGTAEDRTFDARDAVEVTWSGVRGRDAISPYEIRHRAAVDAATRDVVRHGMRFVLDGVEEGTGDTTWALYGPSPGMPEEVSAWGDGLEVRYQGRVLSGGQDLSADRRDARLADSSARALGWSRTPGEASYSARTGAVRVVDGMATVELTTESRSSWGAGPAAGSLRVTTTAVFQDRWAYPARVGQEVVEEQEDASGVTVAWSRRDTYVLVAVARGSEPLPWKAEGAPFREAPPGVEWSPRGTSFPATGSGPASFSIEDADARAERDPTLVRFALWKAANPGARVVGATFAMGVLGPQVTLTYAAPGAATAFIVAQYQVQSAWSNDERAFGEVALPPYLRFDEDDLPVRFATVGWAVDRWREATRPAAGPDANVFDWGLTSAVVAPRVCANDVDGPGNVIVCDPRPGDVRALLATVTLGRTDQQVDATTRPLSNGFTLANVDLATGNVTAARLSTYWLDVPKDAVPLGGGQAAPVKPSGAPAVAAPVATASATIVLVGLLAWFWPLVKFASAQALLAFPGYTRLKRAELLDNKVRDALVACIRANPGVSPPALQTAVGGAWSTVVYHLGILEKNGIVTSVIDGRHRRFFPTGAVDRRDVKALAILANARTRQVYDHVRANPGTDRKAVATLLGVSLPATLWHVRRLEGAGLVDGRKEGRAVRFYARPGEA